MVRLTGAAVAMPCATTGTAPPSTVATGAAATATHAPRTDRARGTTSPPASSKTISFAPASESARTARATAASSIPFTAVLPSPQIAWTTTPIITGLTP